MDTRKIFDDIKNRLEEPVLNFSLQKNEREHLDVVRLSKFLTPVIQGSRWTLHTLLYSFADWDEEDEPSRLYRVDLSKDTLKKSQNFPDQQKVAFYLVLNADRIPQANPEADLPTIDGELCPADEWCYKMQDLLFGLAHELLYYETHWTLATLEIDEKSFQNPYTPNNYRDKNLLCSNQCVAAALYKFETLYGIELNSLEQYTHWQQKFTDDKFPFYIMWRKKWVCKEQITRAIQDLFGINPFLERCPNGRIDLSKIKETDHLG